MTWLLFIGFSIAAYIGLSIMGQLTGGGASSALGAGISLFRPYAFIALIISNVFWVTAIYFGLKETKFAVPALIAIGVITSFAYAYLFLGSSITLTKIGGLILILVGIYLLS